MKTIVQVNTKEIKMRIKRIIIAVFILSLMMPNIQTAFASSLSENREEHYIDNNGNKYDIFIKTSNEQLVVDVYINGILNDSTITNKYTGDMTVTQYCLNNTRSNNIESDNSYSAKQSSYNIDDFLTTIEDNGASLFSTIPYTPNYTYYGEFKTDYTYNGKILYGSAYYQAYEPSSSNRYNGKLVSIPMGTTLSAIVSIFSFVVSGITVLGLVGFGITIADGISQSPFKKTVSYTQYRVSAKIYFNSILTVQAYSIYNKVIVLVDAASGKVTYHNDYYNYNIVSSYLRSATNVGVRAFSDKYITGHNKGLVLPITSLSY